MECNLLDRVHHARGGSRWHWCRTERVFYTATGLYGQYVDICSIIVLELTFLVATIAGGMFEVCTADPQGLPQSSTRYVYRAQQDKLTLRSTWRRWGLSWRTSTVYSARSRARAQRMHRLSAYLYESTNNSIYEQTAQLSLDFIINHLLAGDLAFDTFTLSSCKKAAGLLTLNQAFFVEGGC